MSEGTQSRQRLSRGDSPASLSVLPGSDEAQMMTAISGLKCLEDSGKSLPDGSWQKTFMGSLVTMEDWYSDRCTLTWKQKATKLCRQSFFQLAASVPRTGDTGSSLWPTIRASDGEHGGPNQRGSKGDLGLPSAVVMWPTPKQAPSGPDFARAGRPESGGDDLATAVARQTWPTPSARDHASVGAAELAELADAQREGRPMATPHQRLRNMVLYQSPMPSDVDGGRTTKGRHRQNETGIRVQAGGQLSPTFVEWLMGFPLGWTDLEDSETP